MLHLPPSPAPIERGETGPGKGVNSLSATDRGPLERVLAQLPLQPARRRPRDVRGTSPNSRPIGGDATRSHRQTRNHSMNDALASTFSDSSVFVDVSKKKLDVCLLGGKSKQSCSFDNTVGGVASLIERLRSHPVRLIVLEATGRYERRCGVELMTHGFEVAIVNPRRPRDYAKCQNLLAKTDTIDAFILASFAQVIGPRASSLPSANQLLLDEMVARRRQVVQMHAQEGNRLQQAFEKKIQSS